MSHFIWCRKLASLHPSSPHTVLILVSRWILWGNQNYATISSSVVFGRYPGLSSSPGHILCTAWWKDISPFQCIICLVAAPSTCPRAKMMCRFEFYRTGNALPHTYILICCLIHLLRRSGCSFPHYYDCSMFWTYLVSLSSSLIFIIMLLIFVCLVLS